jgi:hypothetical protein
MRGVEACPGLGIGREVRSHEHDLARDFWRGCVAECRKADARGLAIAHAVNVHWRDGSFHQQGIAVGHDFHDDFCGAHHAADGVESQLVHHAIIRRAHKATVLRITCRNAAYLLLV